MPSPSSLSPPPLSLPLSSYIPACCFFFLFTAAQIISRSSSSGAPPRRASRNDTSLAPNKHTWEVREVREVREGGRQGGREGGRKGGRGREREGVRSRQQIKGKSTGGREEGTMEEGHTLRLPSAVSRSRLHEPQKCSLMEVIKPTCPS